MFCMTMRGAQALALAAGFSPPPPSLSCRTFGAKWRLTKIMLQNGGLGFLFHYFCSLPPTKIFIASHHHNPTYVSYSVRQSAILSRVCNIVGNLNANWTKCTCCIFLKTWKITKKVAYVTSRWPKSFIVTFKWTIQFEDKLCTFFDQNVTLLSSKKVRMMGTSLLLKS